MGEHESTKKYLNNFKKHFRSHGVFSKVLGETIIGLKTGPEGIKKSDGLLYFNADVLQRILKSICNVLEHSFDVPAVYLRKVYNYSVP